MNSATDIEAQLRHAAATLPDWRGLDLSRQRAHIAIYREPFLSYVFAGKKTVESRFSLHRIVPYGQVTSGDVVFMKAGPIVGCFAVAWVKYVDLRDVPLEYLAAHYGKQICASSDFWQQKANKRYATLMGIRDVRRLSPVTIQKTDRRAWLALSR